MAQTKFISEEVIKHRMAFLSSEGEALVELYLGLHKGLRKELYQSSSSRFDDFNNENLFEFFEQSLSNLMDTEYKIHQDHDLFHYQIKFETIQEQRKLIDKHSYFHESLFHLPFYPTTVPVGLRELINCDTEIFEEYYRKCLSAYIKKFYLRGSLSQFWVNFDLLYRNGFTQYLNDFWFPYKKSIADIDDDLKNTTDGGIYGYLDGCELYTDYKTLDGGNNLMVQLLRFNIGKPFFNRYQPVNFNSFTTSLRANPIDFLPNPSDLDEYIKCESDPINFLRDKFNLPRIGEGWISETRLFYQIKKLFPNQLIIQHGKPKWLGRQHFDIYFPLLNIAIEYQGRQHFEAINYFGGEESFKKNIERDNRKRKKAMDNNCILIYVEKGYEIDHIKNAIIQSENYSSLI